MRRGAATALLAALPLVLTAGCGGPRALTQAEAGEALIDVAALGEDGWTAGGIGQAAPENDGAGLDSLLSSTQGVPDPCRAALKAFGADTGSPSAFATVTFARAATPPAPERALVLAVRGYDGDAPGLPDAAAAVRDCPSFEVSAGGERVSVRLRAPSYDVADASALGLDLTSADVRQSLDLLRVRRGANLITASVTGRDEGANHDLLARAANAQADKVSGVAR